MLEQASPASTPAAAGDPPVATREPSPETSDPRILDLHRLIDSNDFDLLSLDVFDTLVWRMAPTPKDVFFLIAAALEKRGALYESSSLESFVKERVEAESRARRAVTGDEVTLDEIYREFPRGYLRGLAPEELPAIELEVEKSVVRAEPAMVDLLRRAKAAGLKTALVSDTYFQRRQIRELTGVEVDYTVLSCERRISKPLGLHQALIDESRVPAERILHVGDSYEADVEGPATFNIARYWYRKFPDAYQDLIQAELPATYGARVALGTSHDGGITALRGRTMFRCESEHERWGAGILGPLVAGFSEWVVERCRDLEIHHALCLMREGRFLKRLIDLRGTALATRELYVSRFVARKAAIFDGSEAELRSFVLRPSAQERRRILEQLGLDADAVDLGDPDERLSPQATRALVHEIARDPSLRERVVASSAVARERLLRHVTAALGGDRPRAVAIVDLGYRGTIQECLQKIFDRERLGVATHGLYLVTGGEVHVTQAQGCAVEGWLAENGQPSAMAHTFMRSPEIVEQSLMADCGTTLGHTESGAPVLDELHIPEEQRRQMAEIQDGALRFTRSWIAHQAAHGTGAPAGLQSYGRAICMRSVSRPFEVELELFGHWRHDENFGSRDVRTLIDVVGLDDWEKSHLSAHQLASLPSARVHWPFGFARTLSPSLAEAVANIYLRVAPPETFDSGHAPRCFTFLWDEGGGFHPDDSSLQEFRINSRGRVWHRIRQRLVRRTQLRYGFMLGAPGELLAMTGIVLRLRPDGGPEQCVRLTPESIAMNGYQTLAPGLFAVAESPAWLEIPTGEIRGFTGVADVDLFFALIPPP